MSRYSARGPYGTTQCNAPFLGTAKSKRSANGLGTGSDKLGLDKACCSGEYIAAEEIAFAKVLPREVLPVLGLNSISA